MRGKLAILPLAAAVIVAACNEGPDALTSPDQPLRPQFIVAGAGFTTDNPYVDGTGNCLNGNPNLTIPHVNCNQYNGKRFVWLNGGPSHGGTPALTDGVYFFTITEPSGQGGLHLVDGPNDGGLKVLSDNDPAGGAPTADCGTDTGCGDTYVNRRFVVSGGQITQYLSDADVSTPDHDTYADQNLGLMIRAFYFDDTSNRGGVYIMGLCRIDTQSTYDADTREYNAVGDKVDPSSCKYDAFKVKEGEPNCFPNCIDEFGQIAGLKYYDANRNGKYDAGEAGIGNWPIDYNDGVGGTVNTDDPGGTFLLSLLADTYTFKEQPLTGWIQTGNTTNQVRKAPDAAIPFGALANYVYTIDVKDNDDITGVNFGNVCELANTGGLTLGFWSNNNGRAVLSQNDKAWRTLLNGYNLKQPGKPNPVDFDISTSAAFNATDAKKKVDVGAYPDFRTWLLGANASLTSDMAYMLSAQMAATILNINYGFGNVMQDRDALVLYNGAWIKISALVDMANSALAGVGSPTRAQLEAFKNIFDRLNNNVQTVTPSTKERCVTAYGPR